MVVLEGLSCKLCGEGNILHPREIAEDRREDCQSESDQGFNNYICGHRELVLFKL